MVLVICSCNSKAIIPNLENIWTVMRNPYGYRNSTSRGKEPWTNPCLALFWFRWEISKESIPNYRSQTAMPTVKIIIPTTSLEYRISQIPHASQHYHASPLFFFFCSTFNSNARLICGNTPPNAIVARISVSSSSSPRMASCRWRGVIRFTFRSLAALPASSSTSAVRYSSTAVTYTAAGAY